MRVLLKLLAALAVLVVACPCALGIATPMATTIAMARAARRGTLLRSGAVLEALAGVRKVAFDKTGTVTLGRPVVQRLRLLDAADTTGADAWAIAAAVELGVDHPFARAIVERARGDGIEIPPAQNTRAIPGGGAQATLAGRSVILGSERVLAAAGILGPWPAQADGASRVGLAVDGRLLAQIELRDPARAEAAAAVGDLGSLGVAVALLSGDRPAAVDAVAREAGFVAAEGGLTPLGKAERVRLMAEGGLTVAMVGDGINDAPALAAATVGIAFGAATDLARATSDVVLLREDLREVPKLIALARRTLRIVRQNLAWAIGYNSLGIVVAALGWLRPVVAAAAMVTSSLFVVGNSLRLTRPD